MLFSGQFEVKIMQHHLRIISFFIATLCCCVVHGHGDVKVTLSSHATGEVKRHSGSFDETHSLVGLRATHSCLLQFEYN
jgi:hypothetical protein